MSLLASPAKKFKRALFSLDSVGDALMPPIFASRNQAGLTDWG
jgi:hypothetical protein